MRIRIDRLDVRVQGLDAAAVRAALDRLPARLAAALRQPPGTAHPLGDVRLAAGAGAPALATALAQRIAAAVPRGRVVPVASGGASSRAEGGE
jgi:hypothetical protein